MSINETKKSGEQRGKVDTLVGCDWFSCNEPATIRVPRANSNFCEEHYLQNCLRFGCDLKGEPIEAPNVTNEPPRLGKDS
jgi:hypothetical protein